MTSVLRNVAARHSRQLPCLRASNPAAFDRYTTIWSFFRKQSTRPPPTTPSRLISYRFHRFTSVSVTRSTIRTFTSSIVYRNAGHSNLPPKPSQEPKEDRPPDTNPSPPPEYDPSRLDNYPRLFRRLALSLPHLHRPTRDDFLNAASGFWERLRIRLRWLTIRSFRKYNADDISAFVTWFFMSQTLWLLVGTYVLPVIRDVNV